MPEADLLLSVELRQGSLRPGWRNPGCPHYQRCLTAAAHANTDLSCTGCEFEHAGEHAVTSEDGAGIYALLVAVFKPEIYDEHLPQTWREAFLSCSRPLTN